MGELSQVEGARLRPVILSTAESGGGAAILRIQSDVSTASKRRRPWRYLSRSLFSSIRGKILLVFIGALALGTAASVFVAGEVAYLRLNERIDDELQHEVTKLRRLVRSTNPATGLPFDGDVHAVFSAFLERTTPSNGEIMLTFVGGAPFLRSGRVPGYRLDTDSELMARWGNLTQPERSKVDTPAGTVEYLAVPLEQDGEVLGVFVVAQLRSLRTGPIRDAIFAAGTVGVAVLLLGSVLAWFVTDRILSRVRKMTGTARTISESDLTQRIELSGHDELTELAGTFNSMLHRLESAFADQQRFLDDAGHELKTPITIVRGHLELLGEDPQEQAETVALVTDELDRMSRMVGELLLLAKAQRPDFLHLDMVDMGDLLAELLAKAEVLAPRSWLLEGERRGSLPADRQRLTEALMELATNAIRHTKEDDVIALGAEVEGSEARFWVRDQGIGIAPADQATLFERFQRGGTGRRADGAGLGLSIVRAIAQAHGGRAEVQSAPGQGALFTIVLPMVLPVARPAAPGGEK